jgi:hypothetical protein
LQLKLPNSYLRFLENLKRPMQVKTAAGTFRLLPSISWPRTMSLIDGNPKRKPDTLAADKALGSDDLRSLLRWLGIEPFIPRRKTTNPV